MRTFLVEAGFLGLLGGIAGTVIGVIIFIVIGDIANNYLTSQGLRGVPITLTWDIPIGAVLGAMVVSVLAGAFPARQASRLSAREAVEA
jgi:putative ABC transport system permease protein